MLSSTGACVGITASTGPGVISISEAVGATGVCVGRLKGAAV